VVSALALAFVPGARAAGASLHARSNQLVDRGHVVQLRGVDRSGLEYACIQGWGFFDSPHPARIDSPTMIAAMKSWDINAVRVPLNEDCWLGVNTSSRFAGARYRQTVKRYVNALRAAHLYVIIDLHVVAPRAIKSTRVEKMPDADHAPAFWRSVARTFKPDHGLIFDLYNEPHGVGWGCWLHGCRVTAVPGHPGYRATGMQQLVDAVRSTGARQPLLIGGLQWALDLSGWVAHEPRDRLHQLVASDHTFGGLSPCGSGCRSAILATHQRVPVVFGELGEIDCGHGYIDQMMPFADQHGISYLGWTWDATSTGTWTCRRGPSLIKSYNGVPTGFGVGFRDHLQALGRPFRP
jgi:endoglucanase